MEYNFLSPRMHNHMPPIFQSAIPSLYPMPKTCLILCSKTTHSSITPPFRILCSHSYSTATIIANYGYRQTRIQHRKVPKKVFACELKVFDEKDLNFTNIRSLGDVGFGENVNVDMVPKKGYVSNLKVLNKKYLNFRNLRSFGGNSNVDRVPNKGYACNLKVLDEKDLNFRNVRCLDDVGFGRKSNMITVPKKVYTSNLNVLEEKDLNFKNLRSLGDAGFGGNVNLDIVKELKWYSEMLGKCAKNFWCREGKALHCQLIKSENEPDAHLWVSLINFYAKCGALAYGCKVLDMMPRRDVVSWTALISGFVTGGYSRESLELLCRMRRDGIRPNVFTLATILKGCAMCLSLEFGKQLHAYVVKVGAFSDIYVGSALVDLYAKCGEMKCAAELFFFMPEQNDVSWNALLNGYAAQNNGEEVFRLFSRMTEMKMRFNYYTLSTVLKGCASSGNLLSGQVVHAMAIKIGGEYDDFISSGLVDMYSKCGFADEALKVFMGIKEPDVVAWSSVIDGLAQKGRKQKATELFHLMRLSGMDPNQFTLASVVRAAADFDDLYYCKSIHACVFKFGYETEHLVNNSLITMYMKLCYGDDAFKVFNAMKYQDVVSWNALLAGFNEVESSGQCQRLYKEMVAEGFKPNIYTFVSILRSCSRMSDIPFGKQVHAHIIKCDLQADTFVGTALIDLYSKSSCLKAIEAIFNQLKEKDLFSWTIIIGSYVENDQGETAIQFFRQMLREDTKPNEYTMASCLRSCSVIASLGIGQQLHSMALKAGHVDDMFVSSALVDMYSKCGNLNDAETLFSNMISYDTVVWNTIIFGYSQHGLGDKALSSFKTMIEEGVMPDEVTFLGILSVCSHMGLVDEGRKHFRMMEAHGVTPTIEIYACMVDLLGRAGRFDELERFIDDMKLAPNALIWETILGACTIHGNVGLGERAATKLFESNLATDSTYILLSNIYASRGMWDDVSCIRKLMSDKGIKKEPGCSWVEIDSQVHVFVSRDTSHPRVRDIYQKLEELGRELTSAGYTPNVKCVLHNVSDGEKEKILSYHSERLALGFALISNIPSDRVRLFKNLRVCDDCHEYMKRVSLVTNKEIVVRDIKRFHHFQNGMCSCKDYW
ncbi:hypothetical protein Leryth_013595 [Lithospermum erythrorhizon]|nr:hypothetical protein Leryth_013595 [Lithospermum erythrorhizon]